VAKLAWYGRGTDDTTETEIKFDQELNESSKNSLFRWLQKASRNLHEKYYGALVREMMLHLNAHNGVIVAAGANIEVATGRFFFTMNRGHHRAGAPDGEMQIGNGYAAFLQVVPQLAREDHSLFIVSGDTDVVTLAAAMQAHVFLAGKMGHPELSRVPRTCHPYAVVGGGKKDWTFYRPPTDSKSVLFVALYSMIANDFVPVCPNIGAHHINGTAAAWNDMVSFYTEHTDDARFFDRSTDFALGTDQALYSVLKTDFWLDFVRRRCGVNEENEKHVDPFALRFARHAQYAFALFMTQAIGWARIPDASKYNYRTRNIGDEHGERIIFCCDPDEEEPLGLYGLKRRGGRGS
jgi:hypothetical protein